MGERSVIGEFSMADIVTVPSHLPIPDVRTYMTVEAAKDLSSPRTPAPVAVDTRGRSAQSFIVDVVVSAAAEQRRAAAHGRDIYAVSAPLAADGNGELVLPSYELFSGTEVLGRMALERMLAGLSTRHYRQGLEPVSEQVQATAAAMSRSAVSRRFVAATEQALAPLAVNAKSVDVLRDYLRRILTYGRPEARPTVLRL
jgi:hypothetical protein